MSKTFVMDEVFTQYTCPCKTKYPDIVLEKKTGKISIEVSRSCKSCNNGRILKLVMGGVSSNIPRCTRCKKAKCNDDIMTVQITAPQFIYYLKKGRGEVE